MTDVVAGVAIVDWSGAAPRALVGRRRRPPALAGRWEFPGGKVEPGESDEQALRRECREELAIEVILGERLGKELPLATGAVLRVWAATLPPRAAPKPIEHAELRWVTADNLEELDWIPADRPLIGPLQALLRG
ncbi:MAG: NUDIX domain-containing protein [Frankiaceae bacterium]|jgi:8-oxo-dGTP diphosphatase